MEQNANLIKQPTREEVKQAVFGLNEESAGGLDGFIGAFYHSCWEIIGEDIYDMVRAFFNGQKLPKCVTHTNLVLLPKKKEVTTFSDMRPISLMLINGQPHGFFKSTRGVKQGDPLSPTLFIIAAEALSRGLNALHLNLYFYSFGLPKWSPKTNHLAYVDDTIIFSSSHAKSLQLVMEVLKAYEAASSQLVNKGKLAVYMHHSTSLEVVAKVERITGIGRQEFPFTYLGYPIFYSRRKMDYYQGLLTKVLDKLHSWKGKLLSVGGSAVLISHVTVDIGHHGTLYVCHVRKVEYILDRYMMYLEFILQIMVEFSNKAKPLEFIYEPEALQEIKCSNSAIEKRISHFEEDVGMQGYH
ncbi:uncharacterized protein [Nicotiana tomentosiformis]|uniref:uncharacterized protein n=1 Tax=Nicotiana tomentosiformis TaxID=4098 RepID=UPI00388C5F88